jgi:hypothetical protein
MSIGRGFQRVPRDGHLFSGECDPRKWPVEINWQECAVSASRRPLYLPHEKGTAIRWRISEPLLDCLSRSRQRARKSPTRWLRALPSVTPEKCPLEINRQRNRDLSLRLALSPQVREKDYELVAQFRASCGHVRECRERGENAATRWLCWEAVANESLLLKFPDPRENTGYFP